MITSPDNPKLKQIRKLQTKRGRSTTGLFVAEGEDLIKAATSEPEYVLHAGVDVDAKLLDSVSTLGSGTRVIGVYRQQWAAPGGDVEAGIPMQAGGPDSLNVAMAATVALYDRFRMARHG